MRKAGTLFIVTLVTLIYLAPERRTRAGVATLSPVRLAQGQAVRVSGLRRVLDSVAAARQPLPKDDPLRTTNPTAREQVKAAAAHLSEVAAAYARGKGKDRDEEDGPQYLWYLDFRGIPEKYLDDLVALTQFWLNQMSFSQAPGYLTRVNARLYVVNILDFRWNLTARDIVGHREPYTDAAFCDEADVKAMHETMGITQDEALVKKNLYPVVGLVRADWLVRETSEGARKSYYDLLYAEQRHGNKTRKAAPAPARQPVPEKKLDGRVLVIREQRLIEIDVNDLGATEEAYLRQPGSNVLAKYVGPRPGKAVAAPAQPAKEEEPATVKVKTQRTGANFPADIKDWEDAWGLDLVRDFGRLRKIDTTYGAIVEGGVSNPLKGSIVASNDRLTATQGTAFGTIGMRTFDFLENTGRKDPVERSVDLPFDAERDNVGEDAGELIVYLPNGGQAFLLINAEKKRVEVGDPQIVQNTKGREHYNHIRNPGDCQGCHAPDGGYILPRNLITEMMDNGIDLKIKKRAAFNRFRSFYQNWEKRVSPYREGYLELLALCTKNPLDPKSKGWDGPAYAKKWAELVGGGGWYDKPLDAAAVAIDTGYEEKLVKQAAADAGIEKDEKGEYKNSRGRLAMLNRGMGIPRRTYEIDVHRQLQLQFVKGKVRP